MNEYERELLGTIEPGEEVGLLELAKRTGAVIIRTPFKLRSAVWQLVDRGELEFTPDRKVRRGPGEE